MNNTNLDAIKLITLKNSVKEQIKNNGPLRRAIMDQRDVSEYTLLKWLREDSQEITRHATMMLIGAYLKTEIDHLFLSEAELNLPHMG